MPEIIGVHGNSRAGWRTSRASAKLRQSEAGGRRLCGRTIFGGRNWFLRCCTP